MDAGPQALPFLHEAFRYMLEAKRCGSKTSFFVHTMVEWVRAHTDDTNLESIMNDEADKIAKKAYISGIELDWPTMYLDKYTLSTQQIVVTWKILLPP